MSQIKTQIAMVLMTLSIVSVAAADETCDQVAAPEASAAVNQTASLEIKEWMVSANDPRVELVPNSPEAKEFGAQVDAIGIVQDEVLAQEGKHGSATLIDRCHVITAQHVLFSAGEAREQRAVTFKTGTTGKTANPWKVERQGKVIAWGKGLSQPNGHVENVDKDWALIKLDKCVDNVKPIAVVPVSPEQLKEQIAPTLGFPNSPGNNANRFHLALNAKCSHSGATSNGGGGTSCLMTDGQSGGPVLFQMPKDKTLNSTGGDIQLKKGDWIIVGVNSVSSKKAGSDFSALNVPFKEIKAAMNSTQTAQN